MIDGKAVEAAVKRISKEMGFKLYSQDGMCLLKTGLTVDEPEGATFRTWRDGHAVDRFISLEAMQAGMEATERAIRAALEGK